MRIDLALCQRTHPAYIQFRDRHYISNSGCHGQQLHYLVMIDGRLHGILSGASAVYGVKSRDVFFGLSKEKDLRHAQLSSLICNVVYRLEDAPKNAASQVLAAWRRQIASDWEYLYQVKVAGFETFVIEGSHNDRNELCTDRERTGALYRADNWQMLGITAGNTKVHSAANNSGGMNTAHTRKEVCKKLIFARKVKGVSLASSYHATWRDPVAQKAVQARRRELLARDAHLLPNAASIQPPLIPIATNQMTATKRKFMAVTMKPELYEQAKSVAAVRDLRVTAWVREVVEAELKRLSK